MAFTTKAGMRLSLRHGNPRGLPAEYFDHVYKTLTGEILKSREHYDEALRLYDPIKHGIAAARVGGQDSRMTVLCHRARAFWLLGYPEAAISDARHAVTYAHEIEHAATLMHALAHASVIHLHCGDYYSADTLLAELDPVADGKGAALWKAYGLMTQGALRLLTGNPSDAVRVLTIGSMHSGLPEQPCSYPGICHVWRPPTRALINTMMLCARLAKRWKL